MKIPTYIVLGICLWATTGVDAIVNISGCEGEPKPDGIVKAIRITDCDGSMCRLEKNKKYKVEFDIIPPQNANKVDITAHASLGKIEVPWIGLKTDVCKENFNIKCPIEENKSITYSNEIYIQPAYPVITVPVRWRINLDGKLITCFTIGAEIVASSDS